jgi:hypothetical protein
MRDRGWPSPRRLRIIGVALGGTILLGFWTWRYLALREFRKPPPVVNRPGIMQIRWHGEMRDVAAGEVVLKFRAGVPMERQKRILKRYGLVSVTNYEDVGLYHVAAGSGTPQSFVKLLEKLATLADIEEVRPIEVGYLI